MSRIRSCHFTLVLYPDDFKHVVVCDQIDKCGYDYSAILHDKDVYSAKDEELNPANTAGSPKKAHWHIVITFPRQRDLSTLAKELDVEPQYISPARNLKACEAYHIHANDLSQYQYSPDEIFGTRADLVRAYLNTGRTEEDQVKSLLVLLDSMPKPCSYRRFLLACCDANLYSAFRRLGFVLRELMDEHNIGYYD